MNESNSIKSKPMGWLIGLAVFLITLSVIAGLIGIFVVAKRKQKYRINDPSESRPVGQTNALDGASTNGKGPTAVTN